MAGSIPKLETQLIEEAWGFIPPSPKSHTPSIQQKKGLSKSSNLQPLGKKLIKINFHKKPKFHVSHKSAWYPWSWQNGWHCLYGGWWPLLPFWLPYRHPLKLCQRHCCQARCRFQTLGRLQQGMAWWESSKKKNPGPKKEPSAKFLKSLSEKKNKHLATSAVSSLCVFFWGEFPAADEIQRWFICEAIVSSSFLGVPNSLAQCMFSRGDLSLYVMASWCRDSTKNGLVLKALDFSSHCHQNSGRFKCSIFWIFL